MKSTFSKATTSLITGLIVILGVFVYSINVIDQPPPFLSNPSKTDLQPDTTIKQLSLSVFDQEGQLKYSLESTQLSHFDNQEKTAVQEPRIHLYQADKSPWFISAQQGTIQDSDVITLQDNVLIEGKQEKNLSDIQLRTDTLTLLTTEKLAKTASRVLITSKNSYMEATGLQADLHNNTLTLATMVQGTYQRP